ncbi:MAG: SIR2 family protein [bacterium]
MSKRIFILGAGVSSEAGLPLTRELFGSILEYLKKSKEPNEKEFYPILLKFLEDNKTNNFLFENIELLLTYIDFALLNNSNGIFNCSNDLGDIRRGLSDSLVKMLHCEYHFSQKVINQQVDTDDIFYKFCNELSNGDIVITFNYDVIIENRLWLQNKWTFLDGYGFNKNKESFFKTWNKPDGEYPPEKTKKSIVKVYKLHGSLGWCYYGWDKSEIVFTGMKDYFPGYFGEYIERMGQKIYNFPVVEGSDSKLIEPSYIKQFNNLHIINLWKKAFIEFQNCEELFIIGYSLPDADSAARIFLLTGIQNSQISSIKVINKKNYRDKDSKDVAEILKASEVFSKFKTISDKKVTCIKKTFKDWVEEEFVKHK